jgi:hypothetical protein
MVLMEIFQPPPRFSPKLPNRNSQNPDYVYRFVRSNLPERTKYNAGEPFQWCKEQFGDHGVRWKISYGCFMFLDSEDATAFRRRWGEFGDARAFREGDRVD